MQWLLIADNSLLGNSVIVRESACRGQLSLGSLLICPRDLLSRTILSRATLHLSARPLVADNSLLGHSVFVRETSCRGQLSLGHSAFVRETTCRGQFSLDPLRICPRDLLSRTTLSGTPLYLSARPLIADNSPWYSSIFVRESSCRGQFSLVLLHTCPRDLLSRTTLP